MVFAAQRKPKQKNAKKSTRHEKLERKLEDMEIAEYSQLSTIEVLKNECKELKIKNVVLEDTLVMLLRTIENIAKGSK